MSPASRPRRSLALLVTLALAVVGLSVVPAATASAYSATSTKGQLLTYINEEREDDFKGDWSQVTLLDNWTQDYANSYAACKGCDNPSGLPPYSAAALDNVVLVHASSSSSSGRISKLEKIVRDNSGTDTAPSDAWGAIGYATHGDTGYLLIVGFDIGASEFPFSSFSSGESEIHGTQRVGSTLSVTVPTLSPTPTSYVYDWTVKHGSTVTEVGSGSTYVPTASDLGGKISVGVTGELSNYAPATFLAKSGTIGHGKFKDVTLVSGGSRVVGESIDFTVNSTPTPDTYSWTWYRNGKKFANVGNEYTFTQADLGKRIDVKVVISSPGFDSVTLKTSTSKKVKAQLPI